MRSDGKFLSQLPRTRLVLAVFAVHKMKRSTPSYLVKHFLIYGLATFGDSERSYGEGDQGGHKS